MAQVMASNNINEKLSCFNNTLNKYRNMNCKTVIQRVRRPLQPRWFTTQVKSEIKLRDYYKVSGQMDLYKQQRNKVVNIIKYEKSKFYHKILTDSKGNTRRLWRYFKEVIGKKVTNVLPVLNLNGIFLNDFHEIANALNYYFINIPGNVTQHLPRASTYVPSPKLLDFLSDKLHSKPKFTIPHISPDRVTYYLKNLSKSKATGLDKISASLLQSIGIHIVLPLCNIINCSIDQCIYPTLWKVAKVFSLHKGGALSELNNFRPISILSVTSKIIERHVHDVLYEYLSRNNLLVKSQYGFRKGHSCFTCLASMVNEWLLQINKDKLIGFIALDFRKAFDVLSHEIIIEKLRYYGFDRSALSWFHSYLTERSQKVVINNNVFSDIGYLKFGVPQGSILGPLIFILFINDISLHLNYSKLYSYADDTSLCAFDTTVEKLQTNISLDLKLVEDWCQQNKLVINNTKSKCMIICTHQKRKHLKTDVLSVSVNDALLENVNYYKILGLYIDKNLKWKIHIDHVCNEISKLIGLLWRNKHLLPFFSRQLFYNSFILPKIDYCLPIWGKSSQICLDKIWKLQKRAIRVVCNLPYDEPTHKFFKQLCWHNIYERYFNQVNIMVFTILSTANSPLSHLVTFQTHSSNHNLRSNSNHFLLHVPFPHKEIFKQSLCYAAPVLWNKLPDNIHSASSIFAFKRLLKNFISGSKMNNLSF